MSDVTTQQTLLNYAIDTVPDPLQASPETGDTVMGVLTIIVSNGTGKAINLASLNIILPVGPNAKDLTTSPNSIMGSADPQRLWSVTATSTAGTYLIQPVSGSPIAITGAGVVFQFFNIPVNQAPGTFIVNIGEVASLTTTMPQYPVYATIPLTKFPYGFFFSNLVPNAPAVNNSKTVTLTWQGSTQAKYFMLYNDQTVDVSNIRKWESPVLNRDTTFLLKAVSESNGETVERGLSATINVMNPDLVASSLNVTGDATVDKVLTVNGWAKIHDLQVPGSANVNGTVDVGALNVASGATIGSALNVRDFAIFGSTLSVGGDTRIFGSLELDGRLTTPNVVVQSLAVTQSMTSPSIESNTMIVNYGTIQTATLGDTAVQSISLGLWKFFMDKFGVLQINYLNMPVYVLPPPFIANEEGAAPVAQVISLGKDNPQSDPQT
jgi:hypothetical protein